MLRYLDKHKIKLKAHGLFIEGINTVLIKIIKEQSNLFLKNRLVERDEYVVNKIQRCLLFRRTKSTVNLHVACGG